MEFSRRCTLCGISYPDAWTFTKCPIHDEPTSRIQDAADEDWERKVALLKYRLTRENEEGELIPAVAGKITVDGDQLWLSSHDVIRAGISHRLEPDALVRVGQQVFEVQAYSYTRRAYLVKTFSMTVTEEDLEELLGGE